MDIINLKSVGKGKNEYLDLSLPTSMNEISLDYINQVSDCIHPAPHYVLVALIYRGKLAEIINTNKNPRANRDSTVSVIPRFVKAGTTDEKFINDIKNGDILSIASGALSMGQQVNSVDNELSIPKVCEYAFKFKDLYGWALRHDGYNYFLEFKIVPENDIRAVLITPENKMKSVYTRYNIENTLKLN